MTEMLKKHAKPLDIYADNAAGLLTQMIIVAPGLEKTLARTTGGYVEPVKYMKAELIGEVEVGLLNLFGAHIDLPGNQGFMHYEHKAVLEAGKRDYDLLIDGDGAADGLTHVKLVLPRKVMKNESFLAGVNEIPFAKIEKGGVGLTVYAGEACARASILAKQVLGIVESAEGISLGTNYSIPKVTY
ncbi:MAG: hypothetical protein V1820_04550 [archaeon]